MYHRNRKAKSPKARPQPAARGTILLRISPSAPVIPVVEIPIITHPGEKAVPSTPPAVCSARVTAGLISKSPAAVIWNFPSKILDDMLLLVIKVPRIPKNGATIT